MNDWTDPEFDRPDAPQSGDLSLEPIYHHCAYCGSEISGDDAPEDFVPRATDDAAWTSLARLHTDGCEWIETRAFQLEPEPERLCIKCGALASYGSDLCWWCWCVPGNRPKIVDDLEKK
jgi:hypothetical protein